MSYFACAYFDQTYFSTDCAPATSGGHGPVRSVLPPPQAPVLDDGEELLALF